MFGRFSDWPDDATREYLLESDSGEFADYQALPDNMRNNIVTWASECLVMPRSIKVWELVEIASFDDETGSYRFMEDD